jgi:hypothetical protein
MALEPFLSLLPLSLSSFFHPSSRDDGGYAAAGGGWVYAEWAGGGKARRSGYYGLSGRRLLLGAGAARLRAELRRELWRGRRGLQAELCPVRIDRDGWSSPGSIPVAPWPELSPPKDAGAELAPRHPIPIPVPVPVLEHVHTSLGPRLPNSSSRGSPARTRSSRGRRCRRRGASTAAPPRAQAKASLDRYLTSAGRPTTRQSQLVPLRALGEINSAANHHEFPPAITISASSSS